MTPEQKLESLKAEARKLQAKTTDQWTDADSVRANRIVDEITATEQIVERKNAATASFAALDGLPLVDNNAGGASESQDDARTLLKSLRAEARKDRPAGALALADEKRTGVLTGEIMQAFKAAAGTIGGPFSAEKNIIPNGAVSAKFSGVIVQNPEGQKSLLEAIQRHPIGAPRGTYMRQITADHQATTVAMSQLKPTSNYQLEEVPYEVATAAHLTPGMPRQHFADFSLLEDFVANQMVIGLDRAVTQALLTGGTTESGQTFYGILNTSGIGQTAYVTSAVASIRRSMRELQVAGVNPNGIAMHPADWEAIELSLDASHWAGGGTPTEAAPPRLFGVPVLLDAAIPEGQAIVADWSTITLLYRGGLDIRWVETGTQTEGEEIIEIFSRNLLTFRTECRIAPVIASLPSIRVVELAAA